MHTSKAKSPALAVIETAEATQRSMSTLRRTLRRQSQPGDPEREARLRDALQAQSEAMAEVRGLMAKLQWETVKLTEAQESRLRLVAKKLAAERRQIKKMRR